MTKRLHLLFAATAASALASPGQAQFLFPPAILHGSGASHLQNSIRISADCYGQKALLGFGQLTSPGGPQPAIGLFDFNYAPFGSEAAPTASFTTRFNCAGNFAGSPGTFNDPRVIQPAISIRYLSAGSGEGIAAWLANQTTPASFLVSSGFPRYTGSDGYQFSVAGIPIIAADLLKYSTQPINPFARYSAAATPHALFGAPIQFPIAVGAVALAYSPIYAKEVNAAGFVNMYRFSIPAPRADGSGGLRLTRAQYCGIFNGVITNWNRLPRTVIDRDINDPLPFDVPIRLVGLSETAGTTLALTRALARQCTGLAVNIGIGGAPPTVAIANRFVNGEPRLPYDGSVTIPVRTAYVGPASLSPFNSISGAFYDKGSHSILVGAEAPGLFTVANGNDGVAEWTARHPDPVPVVGTRTLNGKLAYISPEQTLPVTLFTGVNSFGLNTASLQIGGVGTSFAGPDAHTATTAFVGLAIKPPQTKGTAGAYCSDPVACPAAYGDRANPADWVFASDKTTAIAAPVKGYPIINTWNALLYTCYAGEGRRLAIDGYFATVFGKTLRDYNNQPIPPGVFSDATRGVFARNGIAAMPAAWRTAAAETFLKSSVQLGKVGDPASKLGLRNLWIQDKIPTAPPPSLGAITAANSLCAGRPGA